MGDATFVPFFFDGNQWFGEVDSVERWWDLLEFYTVNELLETKRATRVDISELPEHYHFGSMEVRTGDLPSFGFCREHVDGTVTLEEWAKNRGMDLRALAQKKPMGGN